MVSAVILAYNRRVEALKTIDILNSTKPTLPFELEIIVVDNASSDNTSTEIKSAYPDVTLVTRNKNNGVAGWNDGFAIAKGDYLLVLDDDSHVHSGFVEAVNYMNNNSNVGILAFNIVDESLRGDPNLNPEDAWKNNEDIVGFIGCGALIRKELYNKIGGFAEWVFIYTHEFDYAIRCLDAGLKIRFFEKGLVVHRASKLNRTNKRLITFSTRNELGIVYKYFRNQKWKYLYRIMMNNLKVVKRDGLATGYYIVSGFYEFLKIRKSLVLAPVSQAAQDFYADHFWSTQPVLAKLKKRLALKKQN
jgi:GT2 family glycosyltransferase